MNIFRPRPTYSPRDDEEEEGKEQALYMDVVDVEPMPAGRAAKRGAVSMDVRSFDRVSFIHHV